MRPPRYVLMVEQNGVWIISVQTDDLALVGNVRRDLTGRINNYLVDTHN